MFIHFEELDEEEEEEEEEQEEEDDWIFWVRVTCH